MGVLNQLLHGVAPLTGAAAVTGTVNSLWLVIGATVLGSSVVAALISALSSSVRAAATARRDGYALAVRTLIARAEYPYRVRRRVSDASEVIAELAARGNDLQEHLAACRTWVASEHAELGRLYEEAVSIIDEEVKPATRAAWESEPVTTAAGMNLTDWGPGDPWPHLRRLERAIAFRFGLRRGLPTALWRRRV